jgi:hypothetical protein
MVMSATTRRRPLQAINRGFQSITLDPSPRLRQVRQRTRRHQPITEAFLATSQSMAQVARQLTTARS